MRLTLPIFATLLFAACSGEPKYIDGVPDSADTYSVEERFEAAYIGRWSESGACSDAETIYKISDDMIAAGGRICAIEDLTGGTNIISAELTDCTRDGRMIGDRDIALDVAGTDILYLTNSRDDRVRLERCPSLDGASNSLANTL